MKKSLFYIAAMALAVGCSDEMVEGLDVVDDNVATAETTFVELNLNLDGGSDTRVSVSTDGEDGVWKTAWEYGDYISVYSIENDAYTTLSYNGYTFSGDVYTGENRIYHQQYSWIDTTTDDDDKKYIRLEADYNTFSNGGTTPVISEDVITFEDGGSETVDVNMLQVGAAIDLKMQFQNIPSIFDLTLSYIEFGGTPDGGDSDYYTSVPTSIYTDPSCDDIDDDDFIYTTESGSKYYWNINTDIDDEDEIYNIQFGTLPFTIESGKKLNITLYFNDGAMKYSFDVEGSGSDVTFARATHSELNYLIDLDDLLGDTWLSEAVAFADTTNDGTSAESAIEISSAGELAYLSLITADMIDGESSENKYYTLTDNIDLSGAEWYPIGGSSNYFRGNFDGNNKTITGLTIDSDSDYQGLFGRIYEASIANVKISEPNVSGNYYVGAVCGYASYYSTISNCIVEGGSVSGSSYYIGGVVGHTDNTTVTKCYNTSVAYSEFGSYIGGIVGYAHSSTVASCYNIGNIYSTHNASIGGIVGCSYYTSVTACYNMGMISGSWGIAGIVGCNLNATVITACYNTGVIAGASDDADGEIFGYEWDATTIVSVSECYYLPTTVATLNEYGTSLSSVLELNQKVTDMNTAAGYNYYTAGADSTTLPSLMGEAITFEYTEPVDLVDDFSSNGGVTSDDYDE